MPLRLNSFIVSSGKSSPTTDTIPDFFVKYDALKPIYVAAPPTVLSILPNGVLILSKATVPTINKLIFQIFAQIYWNYLGSTQAPIEIPKYIFSTLTVD